jgi:hypothetical protein
MADQSSAMFTTNLTNNVLELSNVVLKDTYVLRVVEVTNLCDAELKINLHSNLGEQLAFQLENENVRVGSVGQYQADDFNQVCIF